jgi:hypothetical protein
VWKLKVLKAQTKSWFKAKKEKETFMLNNMEFEINQIIKKSVIKALLVEDNEYLKVLECSRNALLREEENGWRLRSRATWLRSGDSSTKFFHKVASFNRNKKYIWSISSDDGGTHCGQEEIKEEAVTHFKQFFKANNSPNLNEIINIASLYPKMVTEEEVVDLYKPVTLLELKGILDHFKKERSP